MCKARIPAQRVVQQEALWGAAGCGTGGSANSAWNSELHLSWVLRGVQESPRLGGLGEGRDEVLQEEGTACKKHRDVSVSVTR